MLNSFESIVLNLNELVLSKNLDCHLLATKAGISYEDCKAYLTGKKPLDDFKTLLKICAAANITISRLLSKAKKRPRLREDEVNLLKYYQQLSASNREVIRAFLKGCQYSSI